MESQRSRMGMRIVKSDASMRWPERPRFSLPIRSATGRFAHPSPKPGERWGTAQGFVVQQAAGRRTDDCYSVGLCPIGEFAGRTPHQLLGKQRSHAGANGGGVSSSCDPGSSFEPSRKMPVTPAASAVRIIVPRFPGDSIDSTTSQSPSAAIQAADKV